MDIPDRYGDRREGVRLAAGETGDVRRFRLGRRQLHGAMLRGKCLEKCVASDGVNIGVLEVLRRCVSCNMEVSLVERCRSQRVLLVNGQAKGQAI